MLLAGKCYDPAVAVSKATSALLAMTAVDTTNLRNTFTVPSNGIVMVRMAVPVSGAADQPVALLGVLESTTIRGRQLPNVEGRPPGATTGRTLFEALFPVTGLTPGGSVSLDAAYGVETLLASTNLRYGGPNDTTTSNAFGGFVFEVWEALGLLAAKNYDPATAASIACSTLTAMTALDTTNLRLTFTTAASGAGSTAVLVRIRGGSLSGATGFPGLLFGVLGNLAGGSGTNVLGRVSPANGNNFNGTAVANSPRPMNASFVVTGLTANTSYTFDLAMSVDVVQASSVFRYGGPDNTTADDAWGGLAFEVWKA